MSNNRFNCHLHDHELIDTPAPPPQPTAQFYESTCPSHKLVVSKRLGWSYSKSFCTRGPNHRFSIELSNFTEFPRSHSTYYKAGSMVPNAKWFRLSARRSRYHKKNLFSCSDTFTRPSIHHPFTPDDYESIVLRYPRRP
ncbi:hypothetical protein C1645_838298, partial [Glomus cerebriforme]